jgi:hypothetical protein
LGTALKTDWTLRDLMIPVLLPQRLPWTALDIREVISEGRGLVTVFQLMTIQNLFPHYCGGLVYPLQ